ncbi:MAG: ABC transporter permease [Actinomycetota bacterium]
MGTCKPTQEWKSQALKVVSELWAYRNLTYNLAQRELRSRYKKSLLGWLWSLLNPASILAVYTLVFGYFFNAKAPLAGNGSTTIFALYLFAGLWVWNLFNGTVLGAIAALQSSGPLLNKVYFPPACPALANTITVLLQAMIEAGILLVIMICLGNVGWMLLLFPLLILCITLFSVGIGLALSVYNVFYRDVNYLVTIGMNVLFYATPIIYPITLVQGKSMTLARILQLNPIAQYVQWSRDIFYGLTVPSTASLIIVPLASFAIFVLGLLIFNRKSRDIAQEL